MGFKLDPFCSRSFEHCQVPFGAGFVEAKNIQTIVAPDLDVAVVRSAPLIECFENIDPVPIEMKSPRHRHAVIRGMLLDLNTHDLGPCVVRSRSVSSADIATAADHGRAAGD